MVDLTKENTIQELVQALSSGAMCRALCSSGNQKRLAARNIHTVGDVLTPEGEAALYSLIGSGPKSMADLHSFLSENRLSPQWPRTESKGRLL